MRSSQAGFVTLVAIIIMVVVALVGSLLFTSLLGEIQAEIAPRQAVSALAVSEAGTNWAGTKLAGPTAATYAGDTNQPVKDAGGTQVGVFDVKVTCIGGFAVSTGCPAQPNARLVTSTGYVQSKALVLGQRTIKVELDQTSVLNFNNSLCAYTQINFDQGVAIQGNVGAEGATNPDLTLQGPSSSPAKIVGGGGQSGAANVVSSATCSQNCATQIAGGVNANQTPGTVCPNRAQVVNLFTCPTGTTNITASATISAAAGNTTLNDITVGAGSVVTFDTAGPTDVLHVHVNSILAGQGSTFRITGGGSVQLTVLGTLHLDQNSLFGADNLNSLLPASHFEVESCNTSTSTPAIQFDQGSRISAVLIVPNGMVDINQAQLMSGAILANTMQFDRNTTFSYDNSAQTVFGGGGYTKLATWQDVP